MKKKNSTAMECTFQAPKKIDIISLAWKRNATTHIRRNGKFTWKCSRLVIILDREHFLSFFLSQLTLSRWFFVKQSRSISNYDETQTICGFVWAICRKLFLVVGWLAWNNLFKNYGCNGHCFNNNNNKKKNGRRKESPQQQQCLENA